MARRYFYDRDRKPLGYVVDGRYYWTDGTLWGIRRGDEIVANGICGETLYTLRPGGFVEKGVMGDPVCCIRSDGVIFNSVNPITQEVIGTIEAPQLALEEASEKKQTIIPPPPPPSSGLGGLIIGVLLALFLVFVGLFKLPGWILGEIGDMIDRAAYGELVGISVTLLAVIGGAVFGAVGEKSGRYSGRLCVSYLGAWVAGYLVILVLGTLTEGASAMLILGGALVVTVFSMLPALCISGIVHPAALLRKP